MTEEKRKQLITELKVITKALTEIATETGLYMSVDANDDGSIIYYHDPSEKDGRLFRERQYEDMFKEFTND